MVSAVVLARPDTGSGTGKNTLQIAETWRARGPICPPVTETPATVAPGAAC